MRVATTAGIVEGTARGGVWQFRDIPYAGPPVGEWRFRAAPPVEPWSGVRDCSAYRAIAPQNPSPLETMLGTGQRRQSEDCLTLTVTTPGPDGSRPVMVWIHGGGFVAGASSVPWYDGRRLASRGDVVVVAINYRLGALGFLRVDQLLGDEFAGSGNAGLTDQVAALGWVRDNIAVFGGDPALVTVFGESAGGMSAAVLLGTPSAAGLVRRAIPQSGACENVSNAQEAAAVVDAVLSHLGARDPQVLLDAPVEAILAAQQAASNESLSGAGPRSLRLAFQPVLDGHVLVRHPLEAIRSGSAVGVDLLTGTTAEEWALFHFMERAGAPLDEARLARRCARVLDPRHGPGAGDEALAAYRAERPGLSPDDLWVAICTDYVFRMPAVRLVEAHLACTPDAWVYEFTHRSLALGGLLGACHAIEIPFVFDVLDRGGVEAFLGPVGQAEQALANATSGAWLAFARHGDPGHEGLPPWPRHDLPRRPAMELGAQRRVWDDRHGETRRFWAELAGWA